MNFGDANITINITTAVKNIFELLSIIIGLISALAVVTPSKKEASKTTLEKVGNLLDAVGINLKEALITVYNPEFNSNIPLEENFKMHNKNLLKILFPIPSNIIKALKMFNEKK